MDFVDEDEEESKVEQTKELRMELSRLVLLVMSENSADDLDGELLSDGFCILVFDSLIYLVCCRSFVEGGLFKILLCISIFYLVLTRYCY